MFSTDILLFTDNNWSSQKIRFNTSNSVESSYTKIILFLKMNNLVYSTIVVRKRKLYVKTNKLTEHLQILLSRAFLYYTKFKNTYRVAFRKV